MKNLMNEEMNGIISSSSVKERRADCIMIPEVVAGLKKDEEA